MSKSGQCNHFRIVREAVKNPRYAALKMTGNTIKSFHWVVQMTNTTSAKSAIEIVIKIRNLVTFDILLLYAAKRLPTDGYWPPA